MTSKEDTKDENRKILYTYWNELPFLKTLESLKQLTEINTGIKGFIIKYIRDGVEDEFGRMNNLCRRHAFTAKELHDAFVKKHGLKKRYSYSTFHFHVNTLVEEGFLKEVAKILEGRHYRTYYGRTAIAFSSVEDNALASEARPLIFDPIKDFIKEMNPEMDPNHISHLIDEHLELLQDFYFRIHSWMRDKYPQLYNAKVDINLFMDILAHYALFHEELAANLNSLGSLMGLDQIMKYNRYKTDDEDLK